MKLVDFGFAKKFRKITTGVHREKEYTGHVIGSPAYQSMNSHLGNSLSRQDDLESLSYVIVDMFSPDFLEKVVLKKDVDLYTAKKNLIVYMRQSNKFHDQIIDFVSYCQRLEFSRDPDYDYLTSLLQDLILKIAYEKSKRANSQINERADR